MKAIIIYCSVSGNTEAIAKRIQANLGFDMLKIEPEKPYGIYSPAFVRAAKEYLKGEIPRVKTKIPDLEIYDTVIFGYPVWNGAPPAFAISFMKQCNLAGKRIVPFSTSGSTDISKTLLAVKSICLHTEIVYPYNCSLSAKDNFDVWIDKLRKM